MVEMIAPYTGIHIEVPDEAAERYIDRGYAPAGHLTPPLSAADQEEPEEEQESDEPEETSVIDEDSSVAEIRAYAIEHGIELPKRAKRDELLKIVLGEEA
ncbi:hypothetical protein [Collinsella tanakaei]|nr:hypothetical protein [Collinsella tanakaei]